MFSVLRHLLHDGGHRDDRGGDDQRVLRQGPDALLRRHVRGLRLSVLRLQQVRICGSCAAA